MHHDCTNSVSETLVWLTEARLLEWWPTTWIFEKNPEQWTK
jgi:hypothetical protein